MMETLNKDTFLAQVAPAILKTGLNDEEKSWRKRIQTVDFPQDNAEEWRHSRISEVIESLHMSDAKNSVFLANHSSNHLGVHEAIFHGQQLELDNLPFSIDEMAPKELIKELTLESTDFFQLLNLVLAKKIFYLHITKTPVHPIILTTIPGAGEMGPTILVNVAPDVSATIIERFETSEHAHAVTHLSLYNLATNANLTHVKIQNQMPLSNHIGSCLFSQASGSVLNSFALSSGAHYAKNKLQIFLNGENATANLNGLYTTATQQTSDNFIEIHHNRPNTNSAQLYKGILTDHSRAIFTGKVMVKRDAQKTSATQLNRAMILSEHATNYARPQLEIDADDVKCSHGATVGQMGQEELFYLTSRGIPAAKARQMLYEAFTLEVINTVPNTIAQTMIKDYLSTGFDKIAGRLS